MDDEPIPEGLVDILVINTDGSSFRNGKEDATAGVGVYFGLRDKRNTGEPLGPGDQTNQRAELMAMKIALDKAPIHRDVIIRSDSVYAIKCVTDWYHKWMLKSWMKTAGIFKENMDLIQMIIRRRQLRQLAGADTNFVWVKGHSGDPSNEAADKLAVRGSKRAWHFRKYGNRTQPAVQKTEQPMFQDTGQRAAQKRAQSGSQKKAQSGRRRRAQSASQRKARKKGPKKVGFAAGTNA